MKTSLFLLNISGVTNVFKKMAYIFCSEDKEISFRKCLNIIKVSILSFYLLFYFIKITHRTSVYLESVT